VEPVLPLALEVGVVVFAKAARAAVTPLGGEVAIEPRPDLVAEGFLF
jgi:hypothetical protein